MNNNLNIYIKNDKDIELNTLSNSLNGLSYLYASFIEKNNYNINFEPKLYIKQIKEGSVDLYLIGGIAYDLLSKLEDINPILEFTNQLIELMKFFLGKSSKKPDQYSLKEIKAFADSLDVIARDPKATQIIQVKENNGNVYKDCTFNINYSDANAMQNNTRKYIEEELNPKLEYINDTTMYWANANFISNKQHGKVIIESISKSGKNVTFLNDIERIKCTATHLKYPNIEWQNLLYRVDVKALYVNEMLKGYEILKVYDDAIPLDD